MSIEGLKGLDEALADLSRAAGRGALRRALVSAAEPVRQAMIAYAPGIADGGLKSSIQIGSRLSTRQARQHRRAISERAGVEIFVGPSYNIGRGGRSAHLFEFGTRHRVQKSGRRTGRLRPQPFMRPAWDAERGKALSIVKTALWQEVGKATERAQAKARRAAARAALGS